jgi:RNA polymerase sigma-70 factor (ECF subfamily)
VDRRRTTRSACLRAAIRPLYARYAQPIYRFCDRQVGDREIANDLTAQTFIKAIERIDRYQHDDRGTFKSWLFAIARNTVIDRWRRRRPTALDESASGNLIDADPGPEATAVHRDEMDRVLALLDRLPGSQREIIELRLSGLTTNEIARTLDLSIGAVKSAQSRAYRKLRELLSPAEGQPS